MELKQYNPGDKIRIIESRKPLIIKDAEVVRMEGNDIRDRVVCRYEYHSGIFAEEQRVARNRILPDRINKIDHG